MIQQPRIFVGTMFSNEGELQDCVAKIQAQEGVVVSHAIISNLKEREAHNALWKAWREAKSSHDLFVKVDADTVLASTTTLLEIHTQFQNNERVTGLQAPLFDYMSDDLINGLNVFSKRVVFNDSKDELYCDRQIESGHDIILRQKDLPNSLIPAGFHCFNSTDKQAFHYGIHRMLKGQTMTLDNVFNAWVRDRDRVRLFALVGAHMSPRFFKNKRFNYEDQDFIEAFQEAYDRYDELVKHYDNLVEK
jgi:hypothetical protein